MNKKVFRRLCQFGNKKQVIIEMNEIKWDEKDCILLKNVDKKEFGCSALGLSPIESGLLGLLYC